MKYLFVGGHQDGKRHSAKANFVAFAVLPAKAESRFVPETESIPRQEFEVEQYERAKILGDASEFYVYALRGMSGDSIMEALLRNYSRTAIDETQFVN